MANTKTGKSQGKKPAQPSVARERKGLSRRGRHVSKAWPSGHRKTTPERA